jgi:hypothetical protein
MLSKSASSSRAKLDLAASPAHARRTAAAAAAHSNNNHDESSSNDVPQDGIRRHSNSAGKSLEKSDATTMAAAAAAPAVLVQLNSAAVIPVSAVPFLSESGDTMASLDAAVAEAADSAPLSSTSTVKNKKEVVASPPRASSGAGAATSSLATTTGSTASMTVSSLAAAGAAAASAASAASTALSTSGNKLAVPAKADPPLRRVARRTRRTSSGHGSKSRSSLRRVSAANKDGRSAGAASEATAYDEGDDAVSFDKLPVRDLGTASESDDSHRRLFPQVYSSDSHSEASQLKVSQSQQLLVRELQALLERQEAYSTWLQASLLRTQVLAEQQSSVLAELVTALHSSEPSKAVSEKRDMWLTRIELHGEVVHETPPTFAVRRSPQRANVSGKAALRLSNSSSRSRLSDSDTGNKTSSSATNLTSTLSSASSTSDDEDETTTTTTTDTSSMPSARTTTQSFTAQSFSSTLATIHDDEEDDDEPDKMSPRTGSLMLGAISRNSPTLRQRSDSQTPSLKKEVSVGAMPLGRVVPRMPGLGPPKAMSNEPLLLPTPAIGSAKVPVKDRRFDFATRGRSQSVNLSPRGSVSVTNSARLMSSASSTNSTGGPMSVQDVVSASPPSPEPGSLGSSASSRHSTGNSNNSGGNGANDKRRVSATPASNDASSSKDSTSQPGDDKLGRRASAAAGGGAMNTSTGAATAGSGAGAGGAVPANGLTINLATETVLLHEALGKGGSASVYRASAAGFSFACKVYHAEELSEAERAAAERDVAMMEAMAHTNVLRTLGHKYARLGRLLLYVELAGGTLSDAIQAKRESATSTGGFAPVDILRAIHQVVAAVDYLHNRPQLIVHRDVKSENVFVACSAGSQLEAIGALHLKLGDFDSARYLHNTTGESGRANGDRERGALWRLKLRTPSKRRSVRLSMNVGTPEFMAPEMVASQKGNGSYDEKVDIWSIGMVLFELLTLDVPYRLNGLSRFELLDAVASGVRPTVDVALQKKVALRKLWKLFNKLTEFDAERRPSSSMAAKRVQKSLKALSPVPL